MSRGVSDKITYKPYNQCEQWLLPPSLDELVPQNHFARIVSKTVDELEIEEAFARNTKGGGASRYNPVMLLQSNDLLLHDRNIFFKTDCKTVPRE